MWSKFRKYVLEQNTKTHYIMHKKNKRWIVIPAVVLLMGGGLVASKSLSSTHPVSADVLNRVEHILRLGGSRRKATPSAQVTEYQGQVDAAKSKLAQIDRTIKDYGLSNPSSESAAEYDDNHYVHNLYEYFKHLSHSGSKIIPYYEDPKSAGGRDNWHTGKGLNHQSQINNAKKIESQITRRFPPSKMKANPALVDNKSNDEFVASILNKLHGINGDSTTQREYNNKAKARAWNNAYLTHYKGTFHYESWDSHIMNMALSNLQQHIAGLEHHNESWDAFMVRTARLSLNNHITGYMTKHLNDLKREAQHPHIAKHSHQNKRHSKNNNSGRITPVAPNDNKHESSGIFPHADEQPNPLISYDAFANTSTYHHLANLKILNSLKSGKPTVISGVYAGQKGVKELPMPGWAYDTMRNNYIQFPLLKNEKNIIEVYWPDAVEYNGQKLAAVLELPLNGKDFKFSTSVKKSFDKESKFVAVGKDFADGIDYRGIAQGQARIAFLPDIKGAINQQSITNAKFTPIANSLLAFDSLNGENNPNVPPYHAAATDAYTTRAKGNNGDTGEFTDYATNPSTPGITSSNPPTNIRQYYSSLLHRRINGGLNDRAFWDGSAGEDAAFSGRDKSFFKNSILYVAANSPIQTFNFGSGDGYAWWRLSSHTFGKPNLTRPHKTTTDAKGRTTTNGRLSGNKSQQYTYTITGKLPSRVESNQDKAHYNITDDLDKRAVGDGLSTANGYIKTSDGKDIPLKDVGTKNVSADAQTSDYKGIGGYDPSRVQAYMDIDHNEMTKYGGDTYTLRITADDSADEKAMENGKQVNSGGASDKWPNHAVVNEQLSNSSKDTTTTSNTVHNWWDITPPPPTPKPHTSSHLKKWSTSPILTHPNQKYTYNIEGSVPDRQGTDEKILKSSLYYNYGNSSAFDMFQTDLGSNHVPEGHAGYRGDTVVNGATSWRKSAWWDTGQAESTGTYPEYRRHEQDGYGNELEENTITDYDAVEDVDNVTSDNSLWYDVDRPEQPAIPATPPSDPYTVDLYGMHLTFFGNWGSPGEGEDPGIQAHVYGGGSSKSRYLHAYDAHKNDYYMISDPVPNEDTVTGARVIDKSKGDKTLGSIDNGNESYHNGFIYIGPQQDQLANPNEYNSNNTNNIYEFRITSPYAMAKYSKDDLVFQLHVQANHLNKPDRTNSGVTNKNGKIVDRGWHFIGNKKRSTGKDVGNMAYMNYQNNGQPGHGEANTQNALKIIHYHTHWYDFNNHNHGSAKGDYIPTDQAHHAGYNDQYNKNWNDDGSDDLSSPEWSENQDDWAKPQDQTGQEDYLQTDPGDGYAYFGSTLKIPVDQDFTDGAGHKYRFGYGENKKYEYTKMGANPKHTDVSWEDPHNDDDHGSHEDADKIPTEDTDRNSQSLDEPSNNDTDLIQDLEHGGGDFNESYFKPYIVPKATVSSKNNRFIVDTDKQRNGLPFRLDLDLDSYRNVLDADVGDGRGWYKDFMGYKMKVNISDSNTGATLYSNGDGQSLVNKHGTGLLQRGYHRHTLKEYRGILNTAQSDEGTLHDGQRVPLHVSVTFADNDNRNADLEPLYMSSHGYISDKHNMKWGQNSTRNSIRFIAPERTLEYGGSHTEYPDEDGDVANNRIQYEEMELNQDHAHDGTFTTGYGLRSDLGPVHYYGLIGAMSGHNSNDDWANGDSQQADDYRNQLKSGTIMDFAYPRAFDADSDINHDTKYGTRLPYGSDNTQGVHQADRVDRLQHTKPHDEAAYSFNEFEAPSGDSMNEVFPTGSKYHDGHTRNLDTLNGYVDNTTDAGANYDDSANKGTDEAIDGLFDADIANRDTGYINEDSNGSESQALETYPEYLMSGTYATDYRFYPRKIYRNSGHSALKNNNDPLAFNDTSEMDKENSDNVAGLESMSRIGNDSIDSLGGKSLSRLFTPYWLPLSTGSGQKPYNTIFEKARPSYDNSDDGDEDTVVNHMTGNDERLGGNFFNIEDARADDAVGHMMVADSAPGDGHRSSKQLESDQLHSGESIQPVLGGHYNDSGSNKVGQKVSGFSKLANDWIQFKNNWKSIF